MKNKIVELETKIYYGVESLSYSKITTKVDGWTIGLISRSSLTIISNLTYNLIYIPQIQIIKQRIIQKNNKSNS